MTGKATAIEINETREMHTMLKIIGRRTSGNVMKPLWAADELGLEYEQVNVGGKFGGNDTPDDPVITKHWLPFVSGPALAIAREPTRYSPGPGSSSANW